MAKLGDLIVKIGADTRQFNTELGKLQRNIKSTADNVTDLGKNMSMALTLPVVGLGAAAVKAAMDLQTMQVQFVSLTGGAEQAGQMVDQLNKFAAETPYEIEGIASAARQLLAAGTDIDQVNGQLQFLGDIAAAAGVPIDEMAGIFAKVQAKGKVELENLNQLAERGIPIFTMLSEATGLLPSQLGGGAVSVELFNETLAKMSEEGGFAFNAMYNLSQTAAGKFSTAMDALKMAAASLGNQLLPIVTKIIEKVTEWAEAFIELDDSTKRIVLVVGGVLAAIGPAIVAFGAIAKGIVAMKGATLLATAAMKGLNLAVLANPYVAVAASILILVGAMVKLYKDTKTAEETVQSLRDELKDLSAEEAAREAAKAVMAQAKRVEELKESYETLSRTRAIGDANDQRMHANNVQRTKEELAKAEEVLGGMRQLQKQKESDAYWSAEATKRMAEMRAEQEKQNDTLDDTSDLQESVQQKLKERVADIEAEFQVTGDLETKINALKDAYLNAAIEAQKLKDVNLSEELYQQFLATGRMEGGAMTPLTPIATPGSVPQVGGASPVPVLQDTTASVQLLNETIQGLNVADALRVKAEEAEEFEEMILRMKDAAQQLGAQFGSAFGQILTGAEEGKEAMRAFASSAVDAAFNAATALAIQAAAQTSTAAGPGAAIVLPALITAGMALMREVFGSITGFADGGIVSGPTMGLVGEYPGARTNPEVIAPLDKLRSLIGGAGGNVVVSGRISGRDILISNQRTGRDANRYR